MASSVTAPLERQFGQMPGLQQMTSTSSTGARVMTLQFEARAEHRRRRTGSAAVDQRRRHVSAGRSADAADLQQGESSRCADSHAGAHLRHACRSRRSRIWLTRVSRPKISQLPGVGLVTHQRRPEARRSHSGQSNRTRLLRIESRRRPHRSGCHQRQPGQRKLRRPAAELPDRRQRSAALEPRLRAAGGRVPERRAGASAERRDCHGFDRERPPGRDDERDAGRDRQHAAPAGRQHHHGGRSHQGVAADAHRDAAGRHQGQHPDRSHQHHPRVGHRRAVLVAADDRARRRGDVPVPAHAVGHDHSERRGSAVDRRHLRA